MFRNRHSRGAIGKAVTNIVRKPWQRERVYIIYCHVDLVYIIYCHVDFSIHNILSCRFRGWGGNDLRAAIGKTSKF